MAGKHAGNPGRCPRRFVGAIAALPALVALANV
jgi:hypothetical protein